MAADAACSSGDLPVTAEEAKLAAVLGLATATVTTAVPAELAAAVPELPSAARGAKHPCIAKGAVKMKSQIQNFGRIALGFYFFTQTTLNTPAGQDSLMICSNLLSGVLLSLTIVPVPFGPENSLYSIGR